jgi:hypothetical protein
MRQPNCLGGLRISPPPYNPQLGRNLDVSNLDEWSTGTVTDYHPESLLLHPLPLTPSFLNIPLHSFSYHTLRLKALIPCEIIPLNEKK